MKAKHVFATLGLTLVMGLGVGAALIAPRGVSEAKALSGTMYLYCPEDVTDYYNSGSSVAWDGYYGEDNYATLWAYCYGDGEVKNAAWPGQRMTAVVGEQHLYSLDLNGDYTNVIFTRYNYDRSSL